MVYHDIGVTALKALADCFPASVVLAQQHSRRNRL